MFIDTSYDSILKTVFIYILVYSQAAYRVPWELHNQIQSKIQKVTGGLTRLASRTKVKKEDSAKQRPHVPREHALAYMQDHVQLVRYVYMKHLDNLVVASNKLFQVRMCPSSEDKSALNVEEEKYFRCFFFLLMKLFFIYLCFNGRDSLVV